MPSHKSYSFNEGSGTDGIEPHDRDVQDMLAVQKAFTVQGPHQALAMIQGKKLIENRSWPIPCGWYAIHVGSARGSYWGRKVASHHPELPQDEEALTGIPFGAIVGLIFIAEQRSVVECNKDFWARGPICHVISKAKQLANPIPARGSQGLWMLGEEAQHLIVAQLPGSPIMHHDLSTLGVSCDSCKNTPTTTAWRKWQ